MTGDRAQPGLGPSPIRTETFAEASRLLHTAALARAIDEPGAHARITPLLQGRFALRGHTVDLAVDTALRDVARDLLTHGWTPAEVHAFAARRLETQALAYLVDALAATAQCSAGVPWLSGLSQLSARTWWTVGEPHFTQWATRHGRRRADSMQIAVEVLALLSYLPRTDAPRPEAAAVAVPAGALVQDRRIIGKIDALLARAGNSTYPEEAAACASKAQELMVRYATVPAPAALGPDTAAAAAAALRRLCTESPLATAKTLLAGARSGASVGRTALADPRRLAAAVGDEVAGLIQRAAAALSGGAAGAKHAAGRQLAARTALPELTARRRPLPTPLSARA